MDHLLPSEADLWTRLSDADRRHAVAVARGVMDRLGEAERPVVVAALLHDVGKLASGLGTAGRVVATLVAAAVRPTTVASWSKALGFRRRVADYLRHPEEGGAFSLRRAATRSLWPGRSNTTGRPTTGRWTIG